MSTSSVHHCVWVGLFPLVGLLRVSMEVSSVERKWSPVNSKDILSELWPLTMLMQQQNKKKKGHFLT
ncbi:hypothetical protein ACB092_03G149600 [Castanea dentata]